MAAATHILDHLRGQGLRFAVKGGHLIVSPRERITEEARAAIRQHKPELLALLAQAHSTSRPSENDIQQVLRWLVYVGETAPDIIGEVLNRCYIDAEGLAYYLNRAAQEVPPADQADDRWPCVACGNLSPTTGRCLVAGLPIMARENVTRSYPPPPNDFSAL